MDAAERAQKYFEERELIHIEKKIKDDEIFNKKLEKEYRKTIREIEDRTNWWIGKYADENEITVEIAKQKIKDADIKDLSAKAKEYVANKTFSSRANEEMALYNLTMKVNRDELLMRYIDLELGKLGTIEESLLNEHLTDEIIEEIKRQAGILGESLIDPEDIPKIAEEIINGTFETAHFSDRIWANQVELKNELRNGINRSILRGQHPRTWEKELKKLYKDKTEKALFSAKRLAATESSIAQVKAGQKAIAEGGYKKVLVITEPNACKICSGHSGAIVDLDKAQMGHKDRNKGIPIWHPFCRCTISAYEERPEWLDKMAKN